MTPFKSLSSMLLMSFALCDATTFQGNAQDAPAIGAPPTILVVQREFVKPGRAGAMHEKAEGAFIKAMRDHHGTARYIGVNSLSGPSRALFLNGYPDLASWEKDNTAMSADPALAADVEQAAIADGDLLTAYEQSVWRYRPELSRKPGVHRGDRYMEILEFVIHPGHEQEWRQMASMISDGYKKGDPEAHWDIFQSMYGTRQNSYLVIIPLKNMAALDHAFMNSKKFADAMGTEGLKKLDQMTSEAVVSSSSNLFQFNPRMSYPPDAWVKGEPEFWNPNPKPNLGSGEGTH